LMTETHPNPDEAWSDAKQQITPATFKNLIDSLILRSTQSTDARVAADLEGMRQKISHIDAELFKLLGQRMGVAEKIGDYKKENNIAILQPTRWEEILKTATKTGVQNGLSEDFISVYLKAVHQESINHQTKIMNS